MAVDGRKLVARIKAELRITGDHDDPRLALLAEEGVASLQQFTEKTIVDEPEGEEAIGDDETTLSPLQLRYVVIYVGMVYDGGDEWDKAMSKILEQVRDK